MANYGVEYQISDSYIVAGRLNTSRTNFVGFKEDVTKEAIWSVTQYIEDQGGEYIVKCEDCGGSSYRIKVEELDCGE